MLKQLFYRGIDKFGTKLVPIFHKNPEKFIDISHYHLPILKQNHEKPLRIVHISDLHIGFQYDYDDLTAHIKMVNELKPDIIFITGDLFDNIEKYESHFKKYIPLLKTFNPVYHTYFSYGNHDQRSYMTNDIQDVLFDSEIHLLNNFGTTIDYDGEAIYICGTDDILNSAGNIAQAVSNRTDEQMVTIASVHEPDYADFVKKFNVDLQLSGHSHGGQIRFPIIGAIVKPRLGKKYLKGLHILKEKQHKMYLHVSRGLGTTHLPIRFMCRPEITLITLNSNKKRFRIRK